MPRILIIADDLTGANDSAVQFAERGFSAATLLFTRDGLGEGLLPRVDVLSITTESRNETALLAARRVVNAVPQLLLKFSPDVVFKKIDSTLRGNIDAEVEAVARLLPRGAETEVQVVVAPAYPENGRTVQSGYLYVGGKLLSDTYAARDVLAPVQSPCVPDYFESLRAQEGFKVRFADAATQSDLESLVDSLIRLEPQRVLWVGSAGLAKALADRLATSRGLGDPPRPRRLTTSQGRTLVLFGSMNPVAIAQVDSLAGMDDCRVLLPGTPSEFGDAIESALHASEKRVVISSQRLQTPDCQTAAAIAGLAKSLLADAAQRAVDKGVFANLVISGGDVAFTVLRRLGASAIGIEREVLPGVALGWIIGGPGSGLGIVTKAGGFGDAGSLKTILAYLGQ